MVYPMMVGVDLGALAGAGDKPKGLVVTQVVNWLIKPFTMAALGVLFFNHIFAGLIPPKDAQAYFAGIILLGAAPCTLIGTSNFFELAAHVPDQEWTALIAYPDISGRGRDGFGREIPARQKQVGADCNRHQCHN